MRWKTRRLPVDPYIRVRTWEGGEKTKLTTDCHITLAGSKMMLKCCLNIQWNFVKVVDAGRHWRSFHVPAVRPIVNVEP